MCVSCPGYIASHPTDNVHAMQGVRPFCGLISHFFSRKNTQLRESTFPKLTMSPSPLNSAKRYNFNFKAPFSANVSQGFCTFP